MPLSIRLLFAPGLMRAVNTVRTTGRTVHGGRALIAGPWNTFFESDSAGSRHPVSHQQSSTTIPVARSLRPDYRTAAITGGGGEFIRDLPSVCLTIPAEAAP